jgi:hypothetical protein
MPKTSNKASSNLIIPTQYTNDLNVINTDNIQPIAYRFLLILIRIPLLVKILQHLPATISFKPNVKLFVTTVFDLLIKHPDFDIQHLNPAIPIQSIYQHEHIRIRSQLTDPKYPYQFRGYSYGPMTITETEPHYPYIELVEYNSLISTLRILPLTDVQDIPFILTSLSPFAITNSQIITRISNYNPVEHLIATLASLTNCELTPQSSSRLRIPPQFNMPQSHLTNEFDPVLRTHYCLVRSYFINAISNNSSRFNPFSSLFSGTITIHPLWNRNDHSESYFTCDISIEKFIHALQTCKHPDHPANKDSIFHNLITLPTDILLIIIKDIFRSLSSCSCEKEITMDPPFLIDKIFLNHPTFHPSTNIEHAAFCQFSGIISSRIPSNLHRMYDLFHPNEHRLRIKAYRLAHYTLPGNTLRPLYKPNASDVIKPFQQTILPKLMKHSFLFSTCNRKRSLYDYHPDY